MSFEGNREKIREAVAQSHFSKDEIPTVNNRRVVSSFTLRQDVTATIKREAVKRKVSASHLVEEILADYFNL